MKSDSSRHPRVRVFPAAAQVPANVLRWHIAFDRPVLLDDWEAGVALEDVHGREIPHAFVPLPGGLWDRRGRTLTLLMHPGRIKHGLRASEGGLAAGAWTLRVHLARFISAAPAHEVHRHDFEVADELNAPLEPERWRLSMPASGTRHPLVVHFGRSMDRLATAGAFAVARQGEDPGRALRVRFRLSDDGCSGCFTPASPWRPGPHALHWLPSTEDVCGNRVQDAFQSMPQRTRASEPGLAFTIIPGRAG